MFFIAGMDTGLEVRNPAYCWAAVACALAAGALGSKSQRFVCTIAGIAAIAGSLYGYHQNSEWHRRLERVLTEHPHPPASQIETTK